MVRTREIPVQEWRASLDAIDRRLAKRPEEVVVRVDGGAIRFPLGRRITLVGIEMERKGSNAGAIDLWVDGHGGELGHRVPRPKRLSLHERSAGELAALEIEDASGATTSIYTRAHPSYPDLSAEVPWWMRPLPPPEGPPASW